MSNSLTLRNLPTPAGIGSIEAYIQAARQMPMLGEAVFTAIDGLEVQVRLFKDEKNTWARFSVSGPEAIREDVQALAGKLTLWEFQISPWKEKTLLPTLEDLPARADPSGTKP